MDCGSCGATLYGERRYCSSCGAAAATTAMVTMPETGATASNRAATVSAGPGRRRRPLLLAALAVTATLGAATLAWTATRTTGPVAARPVGASRPGGADGAFAPGSAGSSGSGGPAAGGPAAGASDPATWGLPARFNLPPGMHGRLHALVRGRGLVTVDLATGAVGTLALGDQADYVAMHVLEGGTVLAADQTTLSVRRQGAGSFEPLGNLVGGYLQVLARDRSTVLVSHAAPDRNELWLVGADGTARRAHESLQGGPLAQNGEAYTAGGVGLRGGRLVTGFAQTIGIVDPDTGTGRAIVDGELITANDSTLVRRVCDTALRCTIRSGPYEDPDRYVIDADAVTGPLLGTDLSGDGRWLLVTSYRDAVRVVAVELATGRRRELPSRPGLAPFTHADRFSADGNWLLLPDDTGIELIELASGDEHRLELGTGNDIRAIDVAAT